MSLGSRVVVLMIAWVIICVTVCGAQQKGMEPNPQSLQFGLTLIKDQPEFRFTQVTASQLARNIKAQAENYLAFFLTDEAQPSHDPGCAVGMFPATDRSQDDLVEYRWTFRGIPLRAVQSLNAFKLQIPSAGHSKAEISSLVSSIIKLKGIDVDGHEYAIQMPWPDDISEGTHFSSNPNANILFLPTWHGRVDGFVEGGQVNILIYKRVPQLMGYQDGSAWFRKYSPAKPPSK